VSVIQTFEYLVTGKDDGSKQSSFAEIALPLCNKILLLIKKLETRQDESVKVMNG